MLVNCIFATITCAGTAAANLRLRKGHVESPSLTNRDITGWGGYALLVQNKSCPNSTFQCSSSCCPKGTLCNDESTSVPVCCPNDHPSCGSTVRAVYACSENSWTLWENVFGIRFCCAADEWGTEESQQRQCLPTSIPVPSNIILKSVKQRTATPTDISNAPGTTGPTNPNTSQVPSSDPGDGGQGTGGGRTGNTDNRTSDSSNSGLSQPATIAIAVLSTIVALMAIFIAWMLWDRARRQNKLNQPPPQPPAYLGSLNTPISVSGPNPEQPAIMAPPPQRQELHAPPPVLLIQQFTEVPETELDAQNFRKT